MNIHKFSQHLAFVQALGAASRAAGDHDQPNASVIDTTLYQNSGLAALVDIGNIGTGTVTVKIQESGSATFAADVSDVPGVTTGVLNANGLTVLEMPLRKATKRYLRVRATVATSAVVFSVDLVLQRGNVNGL